jgi:hypothetical protein
MSPNPNRSPTAHWRAASSRAIDRQDGPARHSAARKSRGRSGRPFQGSTLLAIDHTRGVRLETILVSNSANRTCLISSIPGVAPLTAVRNDARPVPRVAEQPFPGRREADGRHAKFALAVDALSRRVLSQTRAAGYQKKGPLPRRQNPPWSPLIGSQTDLGNCDLGLNIPDLGLRPQSIPCTLPEQLRAQITSIL